MLILTRRPLEAIMVILPKGTRLPNGRVLTEDTPVTVTVLGVKGNHVRIGIKAIKDLPVHREEIYEAIKREQSQANPNPMLQLKPASGG